MTVADGADVNRSTLALGSRAGSGGQGEVHRVGDGTVLFKEYKDPGKVDGGALAALVALRQSLAPGDRDRLDGLAAWPLCRVVEGGRPVGFLMHRAPERMTWLTGAGTGKLLELQYLLRPPRAAWQQVPQPTPEQRRVLLLACVEAVEWFHDAGLVIGDISQANVLWALDPQPSVHFLDCDGFRQVGRGPVQAQAGTPDWNDPLTPSSEASVDTDAYKTALMVARVLAQDPYAVPGSGLRLSVPCLNERQEGAVRRLLAQAAGAKGTRPHPSEWRMALSERDVVALTGAKPRQRPTVDRTVLDGVRDRRPIVLRPGGGPGEGPPGTGGPGR
ncbi:hypothetical protein [Streptomyces lichenis]|uniref:Protein kinase domain-containing protein n=1 Tax=Streptomyces lichenis TaxID=2306967 RepID=A0ABT0I3W7_9ACTN|nr:hypothetical protein [Streptomyces lichenis]MCK8676018.1 hypothetical protein [Streptomyces lichenis]